MTVAVDVLRPAGKERVHEVVTPEGVRLQFAIARVGDRIGAFLIDAVIIIVSSILIVVAAGAATGFDETGGWLWAFVYVALFLLQTGYFIWFESRGHGTTPGKRRMGIRIMEAEGGALTVEAITVRNVMRILEVHLPLIAILAPEAFWESAPEWARLLASVWLLAISALPLFNRNRLRAGDIVAGTVVVTTPRTNLEDDMGGDAPIRRRAQRAPAHGFTDEQLDIYGAYELQVLEGVLRRLDRGQADPPLLQAVADRIAAKIGWKRKIGRRDVGAFLSAFYGALRARLEQRMLLGKRKQDKHTPES